MRLIRATCTLPDASLDIRKTPEGRLAVKIALANGQTRTVTLVKADVEPFSMSYTNAMARESMQMTACTDPYMSEVVAALGELPDRPAAIQPPPPTPPIAPPPPAGTIYVPPIAAPVYVPPSAPMAPARPPLPAGDLPVGVVLGTAAPAAAAAGAVMAPAVIGGVSFSITSCRASGNNVLCDVKIDNASGRDYKLVVQGRASRLNADDGSQVHATHVSMGNQQASMPDYRPEGALNLIADTRPVMTLHFVNVPASITVIKRLDISVGPQTSNGVELQKLTLNNLQIQGR